MSHGGMQTYETKFPLQKTAVHIRHETTELKCFFFLGIYGLRQFQSCTTLRGLLGQQYAKTITQRVGYSIARCPLYAII